MHECRGIARFGRNPALAMVAPPHVPFFQAVTGSDRASWRGIHGYARWFPWQSSSTSYRVAVGGDRLTL